MITRVSPPQREAGRGDSEKGGAGGGGRALGRRRPRFWLWGLFPLHLLTLSGPGPSLPSLGCLRRKETPRESPSRVPRGPMSPACLPSPLPPAVSRCPRDRQCAEFSVTLRGANSAKGLHRPSGRKARASAEGSPGDLAARGDSRWGSWAGGGGPTSERRRICVTGCGGEGGRKRSSGEIRSRF